MAVHVFGRQQHGERLLPHVFRLVACTRWPACGGGHGHGTRRCRRWHTHLRCTPPQHSAHPAFVAPGQRITTHAASLTHHMPCRNLGSWLNRTAPSVLLQLEAEKAKLNVVTGMHVYSVQPGVPKASQGHVGGGGAGGGEGGCRARFRAHGRPHILPLCSPGARHPELAHAAWLPARSPFSATPFLSIHLPLPDAPSPFSHLGRTPATFTTQTLRRPRSCSSGCWPPRQVCPAHAAPHAGQAGRDGSGS